MTQRSISKRCEVPMRLTWEYQTTASQLCIYLMQSGLEQTCGEVCLKSPSILIQITVQPPRRRSFECLWLFIYCRKIIPTFLWEGSQDTRHSEKRSAKKKSSLRYWSDTWLIRDWMLAFQCCESFSSENKKQGALRSHALRAPACLQSHTAEECGTLSALENPVSYCCWVKFKGNP